MTDTTLLYSLFGFAMLLAGLALAAHESGRLARQRRSRIRLQPQQAQATRWRNR